MKTETSNSMPDSNTDEDNKKRYLAAKKEEEKKMEELIWKIYFSEENLDRPSFFIEDCGD